MGHGVPGRQQEKVPEVTAAEAGLSDQRVTPAAQGKGWAPTSLDSWSSPQKKPSQENGQGKGASGTALSAPGPSPQLAHALDTQALTSVFLPQQEQWQ